MITTIRSELNRTIEDKETLGKIVTGVNEVPETGATVLLPFKEFKPEPAILQETEFGKQAFRFITKEVEGKQVDILEIKLAGEVSEKVIRYLDYLIRQELYMRYTTNIEVTAFTVTAE